MMKKTLIHFIGALLLLALLLAAYGAWFVVVDRQDAKTRGLRTEIATKSQDTARMAAAKATLTALASDEEAISERFVGTADVVPFLERLQSTGASLGTRVEIISVSADQGKGRGRLNLSLRILGSFDAVMRTVGAFEYAPYDITLTNLVVDTQGAAGKEARGWGASAVFSVGTATTTPRAARPAAPAVIPGATTSTPTI